MNNKTLYIVIILLLVVIIGGGMYFFLNKQGQQTETSSQPAVSNPAPAAPTAGSLSEQPNKTKYDEYLTDIYLGKMAIGKKIGANGFPAKTNTFTKGTDQFCTMMMLKKTIPSGKIAIAIYDSIAKQDNQPKTVFPMELKAGGSGGCSDLTQGPGKYEYKLYLDDILAAVLPFEVK